MAPSSGGGGKEAEDMVNVNRGVCGAQSSPGWVMVPPDSSPLSVDNCGLTDDAGGGEQAMDGRPVEDITLGQARRGTDTHTHTQRCSTITSTVNICTLMESQLICW